MKLVILLMIALVLLLTGCPKEPETSPKADAATVAKTADAGSDSATDLTVTTTAKVDAGAQAAD